MMITSILMNLKKYSRFFSYLLIYIHSPNFVTVPSSAKISVTTSCTVNPSSEQKDIHYSIYITIL